MNVTRKDDGSWVVDATLLAAAFHLAAADVPALMRGGQITSRHERGEGENSGRSRLSFYYGNRAFRLTIDAAGQILTRASFEVPTRHA